MGNHKTKIGVGLVLIAVSAFSFAQTVQEGKELESAKQLISEVSVREAEAESRKAFFESLDKMDPADRIDALKAFEANDPYKKSVSASKSEEEISQEIKMQRRLDTENRITLLKARIEKKRLLKTQKTLNIADNSDKQKLVADGINPELEALCDEIDVLELARNTHLLSKADLENKEYFDAIMAWDKTESGLRLKELSARLMDIREDEEIEKLKILIAECKTSEKFADVQTEESPVSRLRMMEDKLESMEFSKKIRNASDEEKEKFFKERNEKMRLKFKERRVYEK